jgi:hypothetical protein
MLQYADRQDYAEHQGWRYLVRRLRISGQRDKLKADRSKGA